MRISPTRRVLIGRIVLTAAALCAALGLIAFVAGGIRTSIWGINFSVRNYGRTAAWALFLAAVGLWLDGPSRERLRRPSTLAKPASLLAAIGLSAAVLATGLIFGTKAAGGADVHGYVSQAYLWVDGRPLARTEPVALEAPWPHAVATFAPLGYRAEGRNIVPSYSPGIPILMALLIMSFGPGAEYWLTPICGGVLVFLTYVLGRQISSSLVGLAAALCMACSPLVIHMTCWLLGDLPATVWWMGSLCLSLRGTALGAGGSGFAAGVAILIRPNLVSLAAVPMVLSAATGSSATVRSAVRRLMAFAACCVPAILFIAFLFNSLYGSPLRSGYGDTASLFSLSNIPINLRQYLSWIVESHGPLLLLFPLTLITVGRGSPGWFTRACLLAFVGLVFASYLAYSAFDAWWYLRFLLPAFPVMAILTADALRTAGRLVRPAFGVAAVAVFAAITAAVGVTHGIKREVTSIGAGEQKYAAVGVYVDKHLPSNAVVYSMQHSGNIHYYSRRLTIRWDLLPSHWLDESVQYMRQIGYEPYVILDDWEMPLFGRRFGTERTVDVLGSEVSGGLGTYSTVLYNIGEKPGTSHGTRIPMQGRNPSGGPGEGFRDVPR